MTLPAWILLLLLTLLPMATFLGWLIIKGVRNSDDPRRLRNKWIFTLALVSAGLLGIFTETGNSRSGAFVVPFICVAFGVIMSVVWAPHIGAALASPLSSLFDGGTQQTISEPFYSIAISKRKRGLYQEAIAEIETQLQRFPSDVTGQMLIAEIQAENFRDLDAAHSTINLFLAQPGHAPKNIANALNLMADWQLKHQMDSQAARLCLEEILQRLPETPQAHAASQRLAHLGDDAVRRASHNPAPIKLNPGHNHIGLLQDSSHLRQPEESPQALAQRYVQQLEEFPADNETREKLALLYASDYQRVDLANRQLEDLIAQPNAPDSDVIHWLNLLADLQVQHHQDYEAARNALDRIIERYPKRAAADQARSRISRLQLEIQGKKKNRAIKLGSSKETANPPTEPEERKPQSPEEHRPASPE